MIIGGIIGFLIWAVLAIIAIVTLKSYEDLHYARLSVAFVILIGIGLSAGHLVSIIV